MPNTSRIITKKLSDKFFVFRRKIDPNFRIFGLNFKRKYGKVYQIPHRSGQLQALKFEISYYFLLHYRSISICGSTFHVFPFHSARPKKYRGNSVTASSRILKQFPGILLNCRNELAFNLTPAQQ